MGKIYFDGCSYTFGQGLELYCNPLDKFDYTRQREYEYTEEDLTFIRKNRYSGIVANTLNLIETNKSYNGKSNGEILYDLENENLDEYKFVIIQLTHFNRFFNIHDKFGKVYWNSDIPTLDFVFKNGIFTKEEIQNTVLRIEKIQYNYFLKLEKIFENQPQKLKIVFHSDEWETVLNSQEIEKFGINIEGEYMIRKWANYNDKFINRQPQWKEHPATVSDSHLIIEGHQKIAEAILNSINQ